MNRDAKQRQNKETVRLYDPYLCAIVRTVLF